MTQSYLVTLTKQRAQAQYFTPHEVKRALASLCVQCGKPVVFAMWTIRKDIEPVPIDVCSMECGFKWRDSKIDLVGCASAFTRYQSEVE